jgi:murein L,D-transpeptidase YafK
LSPFRAQGILEQPNRSHPLRRLALLFSHLALAYVVLGLGLALMMRPEVVPSAPFALVGPVDRIVIEKAARRMHLYQAGQRKHSYDVALGFAPSGDKARQGDGRTPEGLFRVDRRNDRSAYHLSIGIDYPRPSDIARAKAGGFDPGGDIFIHGQPNALPDGTRLRGDWTAGCIALGNAEMRAIWPHVPIGTLVEIRP